MRFAWIVSFTVGIVLLAALVLSAGNAALPSYLPAWLLCLGIPVGALALVMAAEIVGQGASPDLQSLRGLVAMLPLFALLSIPLFLAPDLYRATTHAALVGRIVPLVVWSLFALVFMRTPAEPSPVRRGLAVIGLMAHVVIGTIAANVWLLALDPSFGSNAFGLAFIIAQCAAAAAVALLGPRPFGPGALSTVLLVALAAFVFLQFIQFLVVWSANLPAEVVWYQRRDAGLGRIAEWVGLGACALGLVMLLQRPVRLARASAAIAGGAVLLSLVLEAFWLVTPAFRDGLRADPNDAAALLGLGAIVAGAMLAERSWRTRDGTGA